MIAKFANYARELAYCLRRVRGVGKFTLAQRTFQFHLQNWRQRSIDCDPPFEIEVTFHHVVRRLRLRTYSGDLAIFYRTLRNEIDYLPDNFVSPDQVRTVIDCGANIGLASLYFAARYPQARILAIEPHPDNFALLRVNTAAESRIIPIQACIAATEGNARFMTLDRPAWGNQVNANGQGVEVAVVTIESLRRDYQLDFIDLMKVDIEGAEEELFSEPSFLRHIGRITIELHGRYTLDRLREDVNKMNWSVQLPHVLNELSRVTAWPTESTPDFTNSEK